MGSRKGIPNKSTLLRKWIGTAKDPAALLVEIMADPTQDLDKRIDCAKTLMPYVHRKQPIEVESDNSSSGVFEFRIIRAADSLAGSSAGSLEFPAPVQCIAGPPEIRQDSSGHCCSGAEMP